MSTMVEKLETLLERVQKNRIRRKDSLHVEAQVATQDMSRVLDFEPEIKMQEPEVLSHEAEYEIAIEPLTPVLIEAKTIDMTQANLTQVVKPVRTFQPKNFGELINRTLCLRIKK